MTDHSGQDFQGDQHKLHQGELGCGKEDEGGCGMQAEEAGYLRQSGARKIMRPFPKYMANKSEWKVTRQSKKEVILCT